MHFDGDTADYPLVISQVALTRLLLLRLFVVKSKLANDDIGAWAEQSNAHDSIGGRTKWAN